MALKSFRALLDAAKSTDSYWVERAKNDFAVALSRMLKKKGIAQADVAGKLGVTPAAVSQALRGDANLTIEKMVKLARAADGNLAISVEDRRSALVWEQIWRGNQREAANSAIHSGPAFVAITSEVNQELQAA